MKLTSGCRLNTAHYPTKISVTIFFNKKGPNSNGPSYCKSEIWQKPIVCTIFVTTGFKEMT